MNEELKAVFEAAKRDFSLTLDEEIRWCAFLGTIERWHEGEVAALTIQLAGTRRVRGIALEDNQRLREELGALQAQQAAMREGIYAGLDMVEDAMSRSHPVVAEGEEEAHADPHPETPTPGRVEGKGMLWCGTTEATKPCKTITREKAQEASITDAPVMPVCIQCERAIQAGELVSHRVQSDGTTQVEHWAGRGCPVPSKE